MPLSRLVMKIMIALAFFSGITILNSNPISAEKDEIDINEERMAHYQKVAALTQLEWYYLAAMDQYERSIQQDKTKDEVISIDIPFEEWFGLGNHTFEKDLNAIQLFNGIGQDGDGDGLADPTNPEDILMTAS